MGMFTEVLHPTTGEWLQIYSGDDDLERYQIGDEVNWHFNKNRVGSSYKLLDGMYEYTAYDEPEHVGVIVIKNHKIEAVLAYDEPYDEYMSFNWSGYREWIQEVQKNYEVVTIDIFDKQHYSEEVWNKHLELEAEYVNKLEEYKNANNYYDKNIAEQLAILLTYPCSTTINYQKIARDIIAVDELPTKNFSALIGENNG